MGKTRITLETSVLLMCIGSTVSSFSYFPRLEFVESQFKGQIQAGKSLGSESFSASYFAETSSMSN